MLKRFGSGFILIGFAVLFAGAAAPVSALDGTCQFCGQDAAGEEVCADPATWYQFDFSYKDCEVKEKCFLGVFCWTVCRGTTSCVRETASGEVSDACSSLDESVAAPDGSVGPEVRGVGSAAS
jgi:hypothetical protein